MHWTDPQSELPAGLQAVSLHVSDLRCLQLALPPLKEPHSEPSSSKGIGGTMSSQVGRPKK